MGPQCLISIIFIMGSVLTLVGMICIQNRLVRCGLKITKQSLGSSFLLLFQLFHGGGRCSQSQMPRFPCPAEGNEILRRLES